jgi:hypothetical protein
VKGVRGAVRSAEVLPRTLWANFVNGLSDTDAAFNNLLSTPERTVQGALVGAAHGAAKGEGWGKLASAFHNGVGLASRDALNPNEQKHKAEIAEIRQHLGLKTLSKDIDSNSRIPDALAIDPLHILASPAVQQFGIETALDPLTYLGPKEIEWGLNAIRAPFLAAGRGLTAAKAMLQGASEIGHDMPEVERAIKAAENTLRSRFTKAMQKLEKEGKSTKSEFSTLKDSVFGTRPELDKHVTTEGKTARIGIENSLRTAETHANQQASDYLKPYRKEMQKATSFKELSPEAQAAVRYGTLREAYTHGTLVMRQAALDEAARTGIQLEDASDVERRTRAEGIAKKIQDAAAQGQHYKPTREEEQVMREGLPTGMLNYNVKSDYETMINPNTKKWDEVPSFKVMGGKPGTAAEQAAFEKSQTRIGELPSDQYSIWTNRFRLGNMSVRQRMTDKVTQEVFQRAREQGTELLHPQGDKPADIAATVPQLSHTAVRYIIPGIRKLKAYATGQKLAISTNPFPHGLRNVGELAYLGGGPIDFGRGIGYAGQGLKPEQIQRMVDMGNDAEYIHDFEGPLRAISEKLGSLPQHAQNLSNLVLTRLERGYRQALLDSLDKKWGMGGPEGSVQRQLMEYKKGQAIRDMVGDYRNVSRFVAAFEAIGGPFVAFRLGIVPKAVTKALFTNPRRVVAPLRAQEDYNQYHKGPSEFELGGPISNYGQLLENPVGYLSSPSTTGLPGVALRLALDSFAKKKLGPTEFAQRELGGLVPYSNVGELMNWEQPFVGGYHAAPGVSPLQQALLSVGLGSYYRTKPSASAMRRFTHEELKDR